MRWLFLLLVLLNAFYFVWSQQRDALRVAPTAAVSAAPSKSPGLKLLNESGGASRPASAAGAAKSHEGTCLFLGDFDDQAQASTLEQRLLGLDIQSEVQVIEASTDGDYWVYMPPLASREASLRQLRELQARKIDGYLIAEGDLANGVSLGIFPRQEAAEAVMQRLRSAGYQPYLRALSRSHREYWVRIAPQSRRLLDEAMLSRLAQDFPGARHQLMPCESIATAN
jgi:cell division septation protein DedD